MTRRATKVKEAAHIKAQYDAASQGRRMRGWKAPSTGPNVAISGLQTIRDRSRDFERNEWQGESGTQKWSTNLIGIGIRPRFKRITDTTRRQQINDTWADFVQQADADCVLNLYGLQTLAVRSWLASGEVFIRRRPRDVMSPLSVPLQIQLIEADYVPLLDATTYPDLPAGNTIRQGIERNKWGRRVAYWVYREHPGDSKGVLANLDPTALLRIRAEDMLHVFEPKRPGQLRGVPDIAPTLGRMRTIGDYDDAVSERMRLANLFTGWITRQLPAGPDDGTNPLSGLPYETLGDRALAALEPGLLQELDPGESIQWSNPPEAGTTYSDYMRTQHQATAAGRGLPYETFSGDIKDVSDRTLRIAIQEFRRFAEQRQWQIVIPQMCEPIVRWFAEAALLAGQIAPDELDQVKRAEQSPHGWQYIHPVQDVQGKALEVEKGFRSRASVVAERGDDIETVDAERQSDDQREEDLGLNPEPVVPPVDPNAEADLEIKARVVNILDRGRG